MNPTNVVSTPESEQIAENPYVSKVTKKIDNIFTGKKIEVTGNISLPLATDEMSLTKLSAGNISEVIFWFNHGRKLAARAQVNAKLGLDLGTDELNDLYNSLEAALKQVLEDDDTAEARKTALDFILKQKKFKPLAEIVANLAPEDISMDFASAELRKPSGKRGAPKKGESAVSAEDSE